MRVTYLLPAPPLDAYITSLWHCEGPAPYPRLAVLPVPTLHLMFNLGDAYHVYGHEANPATPLASCAQSWSVGLWDTAHIMDWPREMRILNVSFRPGAAAPFLRVPLAELRNQLVSLDAIWGAVATEVRERLGAQPSPQARLALLERLLLARLERLGQVSPRRDPTRDPALALAQHAVAEIARSRGERSIQALSQELGLSHSHLITQFQRLVGTTPKALARLYRLQRMLDTLDPDPAHLITWAQVAQQAGYYDEAHFNHDFRAFTALTPTDYLQGLRRFHAEHPGSAHALAPRILPMG